MGDFVCVRFLVSLFTMVAGRSFIIINDYCYMDRSLFSVTNTTYTTCAVLLLTHHQRYNRMPLDVLRFFLFFSSLPLAGAQFLSPFASELAVHAVLLHILNVLYYNTLVCVYTVSFTT